MENKQILMKVKAFIDEFCAKITGQELNDSAKQVYFLDNHAQIKESMEALNAIKETFEAMGGIAEGDTENEQIYELTYALANKLTKTITDYRNNYTPVKADVSVEETTAVVSEETITDAVQNNTSTQALVKGISEINEKASIAQMQEFTHAILAGKKFTYVNATTKQELTSVINDIAKVNPNEEIKVFAVTFTPVPLKTKTIYTV